MVRQGQTLPAFPLIRKGIEIKEKFPSKLNEGIEAKYFETSISISLALDVFLKLK